MKTNFLLVLTCVLIIYTKSFAQQYTYGEIGTAPENHALNSFTRELADVVVDENRLIYVLDNGSDVGASTVKILSNSGKFISKWSNLSRGPGDDQLLDPSAIAYDKLSGYIYIADSGNNRIMVYDKAGNFIKKWGELGSDDGQLNNPIDIVIDKYGNVYVADSGNNRIQKFTAAGLFVWSIGDGQKKLFKDITSIAVSTNGNKIIVCDRANSTIHYFHNSKKIFSYQISRKTNQNDPYLRHKRGLSFDNLDNIIVADFDRNNIYKINSSGILTQTLEMNNPTDYKWYSPQRLATDNNGRIYVLDDIYISIFSNEGVHLVRTEVGLPNKKALFERPEHLSVDMNGYVYISDLSKSLVIKVNPDGTRNKSWGGSSGAVFFQQAGVAVDAHGDIYVLDPIWGRIQKFNANGDFISKWNIIKNETLLGTNSPSIIKIDKAGNILVGGNDRLGLQVYSSTGTLLNEWNTTVGDFSNLRDFAIDSLNNVYVLQGRGCVIKYSNAGLQITKWCNPGNIGVDYIGGNDSGGITIDDSGYVYVLYPYNSIIKLNGEMELKAQFGSKGDEPGQFYRSNSIAVNTKGKVYVADPENRRIVTFTPDYSNQPIEGNLRKSEITTSTDNYHVLVYPNPSKGSFTIATDDEIKHITLTSITGQQEIFYSKTITTSMKGLLFLEINSTKGRTVQKIIVE